MLRIRQTACVETAPDPRASLARGWRDDAPPGDPEQTERSLAAEVEGVGESGPGWAFRSLGVLTALVVLWFALAFLGGLPGSAVEWMALALLGAFAYSLGFTLALLLTHLVARVIRP
jgi:hypothetical protein